MKCPFCGEADTKVIDSRPADGFGNIELLCRDFCEKERVRTFYGMGAEESWNNDGICFLECV